MNNDELAGELANADENTYAHLLRWLATPHAIHALGVVRSAAYASVLMEFARKLAAAEHRLTELQAELVAARALAENK